MLVAVHDRGLPVERGSASSGDIQEDRLDGPRARLAAFPQRIKTNAERRAEQPQDSDGDPSREEAFAEDVS